MCRLITFDVPRQPQAVPASRRFCREALTTWALAEMIPDVLLVVSELVTNGILHAGTPLGLTLSASTACVEIAVSDASHASPTVRPHRADLHSDLDVLLNTTPGPDTDDRDPKLHVGEAGSVVGGRGLLLVEALTTNWGVTPSSAGKAVWAALPTPVRWPPGAGCGCETQGIQLASGRTVTHRAAG